MGLLTDILLFPVMGPVHGLEFILQTIRERVEAELLDERKVQGELVQLSMRYDAGEIDQAEYDRQEQALLTRLNEMRAYKEELRQAEAEAQALADPEMGAADEIEAR